MMAISTGIIGVPDQALSPYCLPNHNRKLRDAAGAIEQLLGGRVEFDHYANIDTYTVLDSHAAVYRWPGRAKLRKRLTSVVT